jgi:flagellar biosynthesis GTPase FlhF
MAPPHPGKRNLESVARSRASNTETRKPVTFDRPQSDQYLAIKYIGGGLLIVATCVGLYVLQSGWLTTDEIPQARRAPIETESDLGEQFTRDLSKEAVERDRRDLEAEQTRKATEAKAAADRELAAQQAAQQEQEAKVAREAEAEQAQKATALAAARRKAFADITLMPETISQDLPIPGGSLDGASPSKPIDLGPFDCANLSEVTFRLAYPIDEFAGQTLLADVQQSRDDTAPTWRLESRTQTPDGPSQQLLARLVNRGGKLYLEPSDAFTNDNWRFALVRRSVLLVIAADPDKPGEPPKVVREIRLVRPGTGPLRLTMDPTQSKATSLEMGPHLPKSISWSPEGGQVILPQVRCRIHYDIKWAGTVIPIAPGQLHGVFDSAMKDIEVRLVDRPLTVTRVVNKRVNTTSLGVLAARLKVTFPQGVIRLQPTLDGPAVSGDPFEYLRNWSRFDGNKSERDIEVSSKALQHMPEGQQGPQWETAIAQMRSILSSSFMAEEVKELEQAVGKLKEDQQKIPPVATAIEDFRKAVAGLAERAIQRLPEVRGIRERLNEKVVLTVHRIESDAVSGDEVYSVPLFIADDLDGKESPGGDLPATAVGVTTE